MGHTGEVTWVTRDHVPNQTQPQPQLAVRVGQQVELLDRLDTGDMVMVRLCPVTLSEITRPEFQEGYVPVACLKITSKTLNYQKNSGLEHDQGRKNNLESFYYWNTFIFVNQARNVMVSQLEVYF